MLKLTVPDLQGQMYQQTLDSSVSGVNAPGKEPCFT